MPSSVDGIEGQGRGQVGSDSRGYLNLGTAGCMQLSVNAQFGILYGLIHVPVLRGI